MTNSKKLTDTRAEEFNSFINQDVQKLNNLENQLQYQLDQDVCEVIQTEIDAIRAELKMVVEMENIH